MEPMGLFFGSRNKLEVAEAIGFFKVAHDCEFERAKVGRFCSESAVIWAHVRLRLYSSGSGRCQCTTVLTIREYLNKPLSR